MDSMKLAALMYIAAGVLFAVTGFLGGNIFLLPVGAALIVIGIRKRKQQNDQNENQDEAW